MRVVIALIGGFSPSLCLAQDQPVTQTPAAAVAGRDFGWGEGIVVVLGLVALGLVWKTRLLRLPGVRPLPSAAPPVVWAGRMLMLMGLGLWLLQGLCAALLVGVWGGPPGQDMSLQQVGLIGGATYVVTLCAIATAFFGVWKWAGEALGASPTLRSGAQGVAATLLLLPILASLGIALVLLWTALQGTPPPEVAHDTLAKIAAGPFAETTYENRGVWWWLVVASVVIGAPIVEEIIYRGCVQTAITQVTRSPWIAIGATSVVFTIIHIGVADWRALPVLLVLSVGLGVAFHRSGRLLVPIVVHMLFNAANVVTAVLQNSP